MLAAALCPRPDGYPGRRDFTVHEILAIIGRVGLPVALATLADARY
jgi:hypothetical protein